MKMKTIIILLIATCLFIVGIFTYEAISSSKTKKEQSNKEAIEVSTTVVEDSIEKNICTKVNVELETNIYAIGPTAFVIKTNKLSTECDKVDTLTFCKNVYDHIDELNESEFTLMYNTGDDLNISIFKTNDMYYVDYFGEAINEISEYVK